jgi:hypothetical protein
MTKIELKTPIKTPNGEVKTITLRRAKVRDLKEVQRLGLSDADQELMLLARLSEEKLAPEDMEELDLADYAEVQRVFRTLVGAAA